MRGCASGNCAALASGRRVPAIYPASIPASAPTARAICSGPLCRLIGSAVATGTSTAADLAVPVVIALVCRSGDSLGSLNDGGIHSLLEEIHPSIDRSADYAAAGETLAIRATS